MSRSFKYRDHMSYKPQLRHIRQARMALIIFLVVTAILTLVIVYSFNRETKASSATLVAAGLDGAVDIPIADVKEDDAKFFEYTTSSKKTVHFFVVRTSDGLYRAATDACKVCFRNRKGYHQEGDGMVCNECGHRSHVAEGLVADDSCSPEGIPRKIEGKMLVIAAADLEAKSALF